MEKRVAILLADGFVDSSLGVTLDVLRTANAVLHSTGRVPLFHLDVATSRPGWVRTASGLRLEVKRSLAVAAKADVVLMPSLWLVDPAQMGPLLEREDIRRIGRVLRRAHARGALVGAGCSSAFVLAEMGLLDGLEATTTWWLAQEMKRRFPAVTVSIERSLAVHQGVLCAGTALAQADLALHLVSRFGGPALARRCSGLLLLDTHTSQAPYMAVQHLAAGEPLVQRAERWVRAHLAEDFDVPELSRALGVSPRTLARRLTEAVGMSTLAFVQRMRVESAVHLLATTRLAFPEVCTRVGYVDPNALRKLIERETGTSPRELRRRNRAA